MFRARLTRFFNGLINKGSKDEGYTLAEERIQPNEEAHLQSIIDAFSAQMRRLWETGDFQRGGNTKTHGIVRGELIVHDDLPPQFRHGIFAKPQTFRAWVRFSGPGPYVTPDIDDGDITNAVDESFDDECQTAAVSEFWPGAFASVDCKVAEGKAGSELTWANDPQPWVKKSPIGHSTDGWAWPSQKIRRMASRPIGRPVNHMLWIAPGPSMSASVNV